jgi:hypothetical protein
MEDVVWYRKPLLSDPVAILAFEGWSDAGNTASGCIENICGTYDVEPFAELNSEGFYNYQMRRPVVEVKAIGERNFHWPQTTFYSIEDYKLKREVILVFGEEPSMKWKKYSQNRFNVLPTNYSGPTGITSVVGHDLRSNGIETSGLWAAVPHYLSSGAYPKGIGALMNKTSEILKIDIDDSGIQSEGQQFDTKISKAMENSEDLAEYVSKLEEAEVSIEDSFSEDNLVEEIEDFLNSEGREF